ncbi:MAG: hypothetical protein JO023_00915, partial [Chloroflexi bacterium]|nr:hypothetical protein [Chloroflexota bacterium]
CYSFVGYNLYLPDGSPPRGVNVVTTDPWGNNQKDAPIASCLIGNADYTCELTDQSRRPAPGGTWDWFGAEWIITRA